MPNEAPSRNKIVDVAKGIAGVFVVLGHALFFRYQDGALLQLVHFTTPLYIFLSGVLMKVDRPWRQSWLRLIDALLKPYIVVLLIWGGWHALNGQFDWVYYLFGVVYGTGATIVLVPLWFLPHFFLCRIVGKSILLNCVGIRSTALCLLLAGILWAIGLCIVDWVWKQPLPIGDGWQYWFMATTHWPGLPFSADVLPLTLACLLAGYGLSARVLHCSFRTLPWLFSVLAVAAAIFYGAAFDVNRRIVAHPFAVTVFVVASLYAVISGAEKLTHWKVIERFFSYLGSYFLLVLLLHLVVLRQLYLFFDVWLPGYGAWQVVWVFVAGMMLSLLLVEIVRRSRLLSILLLPVQRSGATSA